MTGEDKGASPGHVDGRPATFEYQQGSEHDDGKLRIRFEDDTENIDIPAKRIIAVTTNSDLSNNSHILYVEPNTAAEQDDKASPLVFRSLLVVNAPRRLLEDHGLPPDYRPWQQHSASPSVHIILSTGSGAGLATAVFDQLFKPLYDHFDLLPGRQPCEVHTTTSDTTVSELVQSKILPAANAGSKQLIVLLSGDGGVVDTINVLLSSQQKSDYLKPHLVVLPLGTGNALAHSARLTVDGTLGLRAALHGEPRELPVFIAKFSPGARFLFDEGRQERPLYAGQTAYGAVVCSWGIHAGLVADSDTTEYRKFGVERFKLAAKEALFPSDGSAPHVYRGKVKVREAGTWHDIRSDENTHNYILATLVSQLEKGFTISPASNPLDGRLRLVEFGPVTGEEAMGILGKAYQNGAHVQDSRVGYRKIEALRIEFDEDDARWRRVCVDGKIVRVEKGGWVEVTMGEQGVVHLIASKSRCRSKKDRFA